VPYVRPTFLPAPFALPLTTYPCTSPRPSCLQHAQHALLTASGSLVCALAFKLDKRRYQRARLFFPLLRVGLQWLPVLNSTEVGGCQCGV